MNSLEKAQKLAESGRYDESWHILKDLLTNNPNDPHALIAASFVMQKADNWPVAYHLAKASINGLPNRAEPYLNLATACDELYNVEEGIKAAKKAISLADSKDLMAVSYQNLSAILVNNGRYKEAEPYCKEAIKYRPEHPKGLGNMGMVNLALHNWKDGWKQYSACLGTNERKSQDYGLPEWEGQSGKVVVYGEQGLGDEISFMSMIPDLQKTNEVVIACEPRLIGLFSRSFGVECVPITSRPKGDYQIACGNLGMYFRNCLEDFPRKAYLTADPDRKLMWDALFQTKKKPVIGVAWTGGINRTAAKHRKLSRTELSRLVSGKEAHWVSLEYKPRPEVSGVTVYPFATLSRDYDDTAALVASCDVVVTMQTAVAHLAGALGVPCHVMVPETCQWRYAQQDMPWYSKNFHVHKRTKGDWSRVIEDIHADLRGI